MAWGVRVGCGPSGPQPPRKDAREVLARASKNLRLFLLTEKTNASLLLDYDSVPIHPSVHQQMFVFLGS